MASNFFQTAANNPSKLDCPTYKYSSMIKPPGRLGMGPSAGNLRNNVGGIGYYARLLVSGTSPAATTGRPLGDKCFLPTAGQCKTASGSKASRSLYVDNVPSGNLKVVKNIGMGMTSSKGLLPGIAEDLMSINPVEIFNAFTESATPPCTQITAEVIGPSNQRGRGTGFVANKEIKKINPCNFLNRKNPITGKSCKENFIAANEALLKRGGDIDQKYKLTGDPFSNAYTAGVGLLFVYLLYRLLQRG